MIPNLIPLIVACLPAGPSPSHLGVMPSELAPESFGALPPPAEAPTVVPVVNLAGKLAGEPVEWIDYLAPATDWIGQEVEAEDLTEEEPDYDDGGSLVPS